MSTAEEAAPAILDLAAKTLTGDIRDWHLSRMRQYKKPWEQMSEREQRDEIDAAQSSAEHLVRQVTSLVASRGFGTIDIACGALKLKDNTIKCEITARYSDENLIGIAHAGSVVMVLAKPEDFFGQRKAARATPDQPDLMGDSDDDETGTETESEVLEAGANTNAEPGDIAAEQHQADALAEASTHGPEARENAERLFEGIRQAEGSDVEPLGAGDGPKKRGRRRSMEERVADNNRATIGAGAEQRSDI